MTSIWALMGLLVLAYMGSFLFGGQSIRGFGLASSAEYVVLGFVLGPHALGILDRTTLAGFDPVMNVAIGWLALVIGLDYGFVDQKRVRARSMLAGTLAALFTGGVIFGSVFFLLRWLPPAPGIERVLLAGGVAAACAETTRHAIRWVSLRHGAKGPVSRLIAEAADADDLVAILATAILFALHPAGQAPWNLPAWSWVALSLGLGAVMGLTAALLLGRDFRLDASWGALLGTSLLTIGLSAQLGLSPLTTLFAMGATMTTVSRHRFEVGEMVAPTERAVLLPALLLAGARIDLSATSALPWIITLTIVMRMVAKTLAGLAMRPLFPVPVSSLLGLGMISTGGLCMSIGLAFALRFPGPVGDTVLATAAAVTVFGEFFGPSTLRTVLQRAGEVADPAPQAGATSTPARADKTEAA